MDAPVKALNTEKAKALQAALAQIEKQFGKGSIMRLGEGEKIADIQVVSTGSLGLDIALGVGGLPRGRVVEIYGPESSGKTTLTLQVIAQMQKLGGTCAFIDAEHALDVQYAQKLGVDLQELLISRACRPGSESPISPSSSALGVSAATESTTIRSTEPERTSASTISSACSPVSGWLISRSCRLTPSLAAYCVSSACSASMKAQTPLSFCISAMTCKVSVVLPDDSGP